MTMMPTSMPGSMDTPAQATLPAGKSGIPEPSRGGEEERSSVPEPSNNAISSVNTDTASGPPPPPPTNNKTLAPGSGSYAFITHSQACLRDNQPPLIDNACLARRRRRRTSQHDQAILEEEYRKCDRPDKAKRREIAKMVEMGDKEVQIWFQNKRQSARRKMKPLQPHEIIPKHQSSSSPTFQRSSSVFGVGGARGSELEGGKRTGLHMRSSSFLEPVAEKRITRVGGAEMDDSERLDSSQNHGYYSQESQTQSERHEKERHGSSPPGILSTRTQQCPDDDIFPEEEEARFPTAALSRRRVSASHMRLQEALGSDRVFFGAAAKTAMAAMTSNKTHNTTNVPPPSRPAPPQQQATCHLQRHHPRDPPSELSEYIFSDPHSHLQSPLRKAPAPPASITTTSTAPIPIPHPRRQQPATYPPGGSAPQFNPPPLLKRSSSSFLRLSTSLEGKAEVIIESEPTLPPPLLTPSRSFKNLTGDSSSITASSSSTLRGGVGSSSAIKSSKVWEFYCDNRDKEATVRHHRTNSFGSESSLEDDLGGGMGDEAGTALSIIAKRRRKEREGTDVLGERPNMKLVFDKHAVVTGRTVSMSSLAAMIDAETQVAVPRKKILVKKQRHSTGAVLGEIHNGSSMSGKVKVKSKRMVDPKTGKVYRVSLKEKGNLLSETQNGLSGAEMSKARKRRYNEVEIYEQPSTAVPPLAPQSRKEAVKQKLFNTTTTTSSAPGNSTAGKYHTAAAAVGGEDYYIPGGESDKENFCNYSDPALSSSGENAETEKTGIVGDTGRAMGKKVVGDSQNSPATATYLSTSIGGGRKRRRTVLGEADSGNDNGNRITSSSPSKGLMGVNEDEDLGGAELLLSLSAGRWGM